MKQILALGSPEFIRPLQLGGAIGELADATNIAAHLEAVAENSAVGLILLDPELAATLPADRLRRSGVGSGPHCLIPSKGASVALRDRIRQVVGADLLS